MIQAKYWWEYSPKKSDWVAARSGRAHGKAGLPPMPDLVIKTRLPEVGPFDPSRDDEHAELERKSKPHAKLKEWEAGVRTEEEALAKSANRWLLRTGFLGLMTVEYAGINELLVGQGMENPHRTIVAIAGACIFFYLTYLASKGAKES